MWTEVDTSVCEAPATYAGDCSRLLDTSGMSDKDKYTFGVKCGARWPCSETGYSSHGKAGLSFLSAKTMPVDAYKIRNSLYLTQLMRSPPAAAINVIMREDVAASSSAA